MKVRRIRSALTNPQFRPICSILLRLALGAGRVQVFRLILGHGVRVVFTGIVLGLFAALALSRVIRSLLFGVTPSDPLTFVFVSAGSLWSRLSLVASQPDGQHKSTHSLR